ncbi:Solute carrier family 35 member F2 [Choanephora cucurbitarum]|uniref:Solute carrier family 35 member F2 n=1 Tax=Choanephora cucurbitarum TaxID=101091 RepID=A0A1C7N352_9FUNG|nr:Solute carrier family 35 member F2 [Choanephora cucurbitarum]
MPTLSKNTVLAVGLGQLLSLCITGTSAASSALWNKYQISIPFTQNFCNYLLLASVYTLIATETRSASTQTHWQCNALAVLAFKRTSVLSALILSSWSIPCIMLLSAFFLNVRYSKLHVQSAIVCLIGLVLLIWGDVMGNEDESTVNHSWIGDMICVHATLYAVSNVTEEHLVQHYDSSEFLRKAGYWGSLFCGIQMLIFEFDHLIAIEWSWPILGLVTMYVLCLFCMYSLVPTVYRMAGAAFLSMNLITSNFYSLIVGLLFLNAKMPPLYPIAYALVITSVTIFSLVSPTTISGQLKQDEESMPISNDSSKRVLYTLA